MKVDRRIRAREVQVIDENGDNLGVLPLTEALTKAEQANLNLVEVSPNTNPPVCKIADWGKMQYKQDRKKKTAKISTKEHSVNLSSQLNDMDTEARKAAKNLNRGDNVKLVVRMRNRAEKNRTAESEAKLDELVGLVQNHCSKPVKLSAKTVKPRQLVAVTLTKTR